MTSFIKRELVLSVNDNIATLDQNLYLFQNDRNIDLYFRIMNFKFNFLTNTKEPINFIQSNGAIAFTIKILKPNGEKFISDGLYPVEEGKVKFTITEDFMNEVEEIGVYLLQISLFDGQGGKVTIPSISFEVLKPIFEEDYELEEGQIDLTDIGKSKIANIEDEEKVLEELANRNSIRGLAEWKYGDLISAHRMNAIHIAIDDAWTKIENLDSTNIKYNDKYPTVFDALEEVLYKPLEITSLKSNILDTVLLGSTISSLLLSWTYNKTVTKQFINNVEISLNNNSYIWRNSFNSNMVFQLRATDGKTNATKSIVINFANNIYYGLSKAGVYDNIFIQSLPNNVITNERSMTIEEYVDVDKFVFYACPTRLGQPEFSVNGFVGGFELLGEYDIKNARGYIEKYYLYKSDNDGLGQTKIIVK